jgi:hypothetical protein
VARGLRTRLRSTCSRIPRRYEFTVITEERTRRRGRNTSRCPNAKMPVSAAVFVQSGKASYCGEMSHLVIRCPDHAWFGGQEDDLPEPTQSGSECKFARRPGRSRAVEVPAAVLAVGSRSIGPGGRDARYRRLTNSASCRSCTASLAMTTAEWIVTGVVLTVFSLCAVVTLFVVA